MIAEHIGTRTKEDVEEHYNSVYVDSRDWLLPDIYMIQVVPFTE
jgi:transcriptional adapter 2-alpha